MKNGSSRQCGAIKLTMFVVNKSAQSSKLLKFWELIMSKLLMVLLAHAIVLVTSIAVKGMPFVPTDSIALATPDKGIMEALIRQRVASARSLVETLYPEFSQVAEFSNSELSSYCPAYSTLSAGRKISLFAFLLDMYVHAIPTNKRLYMPIPDPKTMSQKQLEAHKLEYGNIAPLENNDEVYALVGRFDQAQIELKARELLQLFKSGPVSPEQLNALLKSGSIGDKNGSRKVGEILKLLKFCRVNP
jgi:hypothetical protein